MKRFLPFVIALFCIASAASAASVAPLTSLRQIHELSNEQADRGLPVAFEATVNYSRWYERSLFVQDGDLGIFVLVSPSVRLSPGDRILVKGTTAGSFHPIVIGSQVTLLHRGSPPAPVPATFQQLITAQHDCLMVSVQGVVKAADMMTSLVSVRSIRLQLQTDSGQFEVDLDSEDAGTLHRLLDATVEVTGVAAGKFDDKMDLTGAIVYVPSLANVRILSAAHTSPWSVPITPLDQVFFGYDVHSITPRVRVQGTLTYYLPGLAIVLQDGAKSLWIETSTRDPLEIGDHIEAIGFPDAHDRMLSLTDAEILDTHLPAPIAPLSATWKQLATWSTNTADGHQNDLVSIEGTVDTEVREAAQDEYILIVDGRPLTAIYRHPPNLGVLPPMLEIPLGSKIQVTGICTRLDTKSISPGQEVPFNILMRTPQDIVVVNRPSIVNVRNLALTVGLLLMVVAVVGARGWALERKVRHQNAAISAATEAEAELERRRSRILEDINGARPLAEILEEIASMVSSSLDDVPCWCEIADNDLLGQPPEEPHHLRVVRATIVPRSGPSLGVLSAAFNPELASSPREGVALDNGARLATLAIETRRLYSDLRRRSEFDLLTEIHNRFSMNIHLDSLLEDACVNGRIFGLIFIDLDKFKPINDIYGHHVGDLYLHEVAVRMKRQLRSGDILARMGGDEFVALVTLPKGRADALQIVFRLRHSFEEVFVVDGFSLHGSASFGIAVFPEDGTTKDELLNSADAAMYKAKNAKRTAADAAPSPPAGTDPIPEERT